MKPVEKEKSLMKKKKKKRLSAIISSAESERKNRIANGTWMGRNAVHKSKKDYDRNTMKKIPPEDS